MPPVAPLPTVRASAGPSAGLTVDLHWRVLVAKAGEAPASRAAARHKVCFMQGKIAQLGWAVDWRDRAPMADPLTIRRLYGRAKGHKLRAGQAALVEELLPALSLPPEGSLDARTLFGDERPLHFEI